MLLQRLRWKIVDCAGPDGLKSRTVHYSHVLGLSGCMSVLLVIGQLSSDAIT